MRLTTSFLIVTLVLFFFSTSANATLVLSGPTTKVGSAGSLGVIPASAGLQDGVTFNQANPGGITINADNVYYTALGTDGLGGTSGAGGTEFVLYNNSSRLLDDKDAVGTVKLFNSGLNPDTNILGLAFDYTSMSGAFAGNFNDIFTATSGIDVTMVQQTATSVLYLASLSGKTVFAAGISEMPWNQGDWKKPSVAVPEPGMLLLMLAGFIGLLINRRSSVLPSG